MKNEVSLSLCFLHCCPFLQLFLQSASLAACALIIADRTALFHPNGSRVYDETSRNQQYWVIQARMHTDTPLVRGIPANSRETTQHLLEHGSREDKLPALLGVPSLRGPTDPVDERVKELLGLQEQVFLAGFKRSSRFVDLVMKGLGLYLRFPLVLELMSLYLKFVALNRWDSLSVLQELVQENKTRGCPSWMERRRCHHSGDNFRLGRHRLRQGCVGVFPLRHSQVFERLRWLYSEWEPGRERASDGPTHDGSLCHDRQAGTRADRVFLPGRRGVLRRIYRQQLRG